MLIPNEVTSSMRWLEEAICETASYFFMNKVAHNWIKNKVGYTNVDGTMYAYSFIEYVKTDSKKRMLFDLKDEEEVKKLIGDYYNRAKLKHIANQFLIIFNEYPELWKAVPFLASINSFPDVRLMLDNWYQISPKESKRGIMEIIRLFYPK